MKIKNKFIFVLAIGALVVGGYYVVDRIVFLQTAERTFGVVQKIISINARCGSRKHRYPCTRFYATLDYTVKERRYSIEEDAGQERGHDVSISQARHRVGDQVQVIYSPKNPQKAYRDTFWDVWGDPIMAFIMHLAFLFGSFNERQRSGKSDQ